MRQAAASVSLKLRWSVRKICENEYEQVVQLYRIAVDEGHALAEDRIARAPQLGRHVGAQSRHSTGQSRGGPSRCLTGK